MFASTLGLICSVGLTPESAAAAMRAGIAGLSELPYNDNVGNSVVGALVPGVPESLRGPARVAELLVRVTAGFVPRLPMDLELDQLPLLLCTHEPERPGPRVASIVGQAEAQLGCRFRRDRSAHLARGSVASFEALAQARRMLVEQRVKACLIAAVDTFIDARTLDWLDRTKRLKRLAQSDGVIPGEAACLMLVTAQPPPPPYLAIHGLGFAVESATVLNDEPLVGKGMTAAVKMALAEAGLALHEVDFRLSDVAGEVYAFEELVLTQLRLMRQRREEQYLWHPASFVGDCGAASGLLQLAWAEQAFARGYAPGPVALAHCGIPTGARAAAIVSG